MGHRDPGGAGVAPRGREGWEWTRIQRDPCPQCGQHPGALPPTSLGELAVRSAAEWRAFLVGADDAYLRARPSPDVHSPLQYGAHVRDMLRVFGDRMILGVERDEPTVPWFDPGPDGWSSYQHLEAERLADDLQAQAARFASVVADRVPSDWSRGVLRDGVDRFTVCGLACFGVHESHHHLLDAAGTLRTATGRS